MATHGWWRRLGPAVGAFRRTLAGRCAGTECMGSDRLGRMLSAAPVVLYMLRWAPDFAPTFISSNLARFCGIDPNLPLTDPAAWEAAVHPDDRERRRQALTDLAVRGRVAQDYRVRHAEGGWRWVRDEARVVLDSDGHPVEVVGSWLDITDRHASEEALAASEAQLRAAQTLLTDALESSGDAFSLYDADDRLLVSNSKYREFYATIAADIRPGITFEDIIRLSAERGQYVDVPADQVEEWVRERMAHHRRASGVFEQKLADGRILEIIERPTSGGGRVAIRRDVTIRKRIEDALRRELTFEQTLIDALPFPIFFKGCDGRFLGCNTKFAEAMGKPISAIIGHTLFDLLPLEKAEEYAASDRDLFAHPGVQTREVTMVWSDGSIRRLNVVKGTFTDSQGEVAGFIGSLIDITSQKRAEEQLVQTAKLATLGQIASEVAHELNQPLSIIMMSAERCLQRAEETEAAWLDRKLALIVEQVRRMAEIVDHLRSFSRVESGDPRPFAPSPVVGNAIRLLSPHFQLDRIALDAHVDHDCPEVLGKPNQLEQVLLNLLSNARDAVRGRGDGGGRVEVRLWEEHGTVTLTVRDNGGGVPEHLWPQVFEPFFTTKGDGTGTGLGLSISANIIATMGGHISGHNVESGACFVISIPVHRNVPGEDAPSERAPQPPCEPSPGHADAPRGRLLLVEDEEVAAECIAEYLEARGFQVATATNADRALTLARQMPIDLLVTDLRLPGMSGTALLAHLRRDLREMPAILMTGGPLPTEELGPDTVLLGKPLALAELLREIERLLAVRGTPCSA